MNKTGKYTSPEEKETRIIEAAKWLLENPDARFMDFQDYFMEKWSLSYKMTSIYRKDAHKKVNELYDEDLLAKKKTSAIGLQNALRKAEKADDWRLALEIRKEINKVLGLYVSNVDITTGGDKLEGFSIKDIIGFDNGDDDSETED